MTYAPIIGRVVDGRYRLEGLLGDGGMGAVYRAEDQETGAIVALKVMKPADPAEDAMAFERFRREARAAGVIDSPHIARVLGAGADGETEQPYIAMEYLVGEDLAKALHRLGPIPADAALRIAAQACMGLADAHAAGIVHRDIKPANLFLTELHDERIVVKLLDFGVAKLRAATPNGGFETTGLTRASSLLGSPLYMAPEQVRGSKDVDHRADLWSLGVVLYRALAGRTPHQHVETLGKLVLAVCNEPPRPLAQIAPWVPADVAEVVHRALRIEPGERFASAAEMLAAIRALLPEGIELRAPMIRRVPRAERVHTLRPPEVVAAPPRSEPTVEAPPPASAASAASSSATPRSAPAQAASPSPRRRWLAVTAMMVGLVAGFAARRGREAARMDPGDDPPSPPVAARMVKVLIEPGDAEVEVDGKRAVVRDGAVEVAGPLDSVHRVRVARGAAEVVDLVAIGLDGGAPQRIRLHAPKQVKWAR